MQSRCALYVDAGYLLAAAATRVTGTSLRGGIKADHDRLIKALVAHAEDSSKLPLMRVHWYDSARSGVPDETQEKIGLLSQVKLRLGRIGFDGEQKGVDLRIGLDLVAHAFRAAVEIMFLVSGDDDLTGAVEEAQAYGVQVVILAVPNKEGEPHGVSRHLRTAADRVDLLSVEALDTAVAPRAGTGFNPASTAVQSRPPMPSPAVLANRGRATTSAPPTANVERAPNDERGKAELVYSSTTASNTTIMREYESAEDVAEILDRVVSRVLETWLDGRSAERQAELAASRPSIPQDVDRALLQDLSGALGVYDLSDTVRHQLRARFWAKVDLCEGA